MTIRLSDVSGTVAAWQAQQQHAAAILCSSRTMVWCDIVLVEQQSMCGGKVRDPQRLFIWQKRIGLLLGLPAKQAKLNTKLN